MIFEDKRLMERVSKLENVESAVWVAIENLQKTVGKKDPDIETFGNEIRRLNTIIQDLQKSPIASLPVAIEERLLKIEAKQAQLWELLTEKSAATGKTKLSRTGWWTARKL